MLIDLYTMQNWELDKEGIKAEIRANGSMNGFDVANDYAVDRLAQRVIEDGNYINAILQLEADAREDKATIYYDILWEVIDQYR